MSNSAAPREDDPRCYCFENSEAEEAVEKSIAVLVGKMQERSRLTFMNEHNVLRLNHGGNWEHAAMEPDPDMSMHTISAEWVS
jgi:hypothetical protein